MRTISPYVAHREKFLAEIPNLGRTYSLKLGADGTLWAGMQPLNEPAGSPGWVVKLGRKPAKILGYVSMTGRTGLHSVEDAGDGQTDAGNRIVWFKIRALRRLQ
jgi:hypothetical protein